MHIEHIAELEGRVAMLEQLLTDAGIDVPPPISSIISESLKTARAATSADGIQDDLPDAEELLEEILQILDLEQSDEDNAQ